MSNIPLIAKTDDPSSVKNFLYRVPLAVVGLVFARLATPIPGTEQIPATIPWSLKAINWRLRSVGLKPGGQGLLSVN